MKNKTEKELKNNKEIKSLRAYIPESCKYYFDEALKLLVSQIQGKEEDLKDETKRNLK